MTGAERITRDRILVSDDHHNSYPPLDQVMSCFASNSSDAVHTGISCPPKNSSTHLPS